MNVDPGGWQRLGPSFELLERQVGWRFELGTVQGEVAAFVLRINGQPRAWLNRCAHVPVELDGVPGQFLDDTGQAIVCATHGAVYDPESGRCVRGPCKGKGLHPVPCRDHAGWIEVASRI
jgi:nitrite reductase/ring-hydroxylating ferredoxin subunit